MLDPTTVQIIKATVPVLKETAEEITAQFYPLLFSQYPDVIPYFSQTHQAKGTQPKALANAIVAYGANIDELGNLGETVSKIVQKHCSLGIQPAQYDAVGSCLLQAIRKVLGDAATDEIIDAWGKAYARLAGILIDAEKRVYDEMARRQGGWSDERTFILDKKVIESSVITSFYFRPADGGELPSYDAGQFITIVLEIDGQAVRRNYSLSDAPGQDYLRISVKREAKGLVSNYLHNHLSVGDKVNLLPPFGKFKLRKNSKPLVLLTGGVGITPAISMLNVEANSGREIRFIHAAINSEIHAFKEHVDQLARANNQILPTYIYSQPERQCNPHAVGLINADIVGQQLPSDRDVEFYFLGPKPFMVTALKIAKELGIPGTQIHYEFFGPAEELAA